MILIHLSVLVPIAIALWSLAGGFPVGRLRGTRRGAATPPQTTGAPA
jgi:hypothetical protein